MENSRTRRKAEILVVVVFLLGVALGSVATHLWGDRVWGDSRFDHGHNRLVRALTRELQLTPDQQKQLTGIIEETRAKFHALYEQQRPQYDQVREQGRDRIRAMLTPEQRPKFEDFVRRLDERRRKEERH